MLLVTSIATTSSDVALQQVTKHLIFAISQICNETTRTSAVTCLMRVHHRAPKEPAGIEDHKRHHHIC